MTSVVRRSPLSADHRCCLPGSVKTGTTASCRQVRAWPNATPAEPNNHWISPKFLHLVWMMSQPQDYVYMVHWRLNMNGQRHIQTSSMSFARPCVNIGAIHIHRHTHTHTGCEEVDNRTSLLPTTSQHHSSTWILPHNHTNIRIRYMPTQHLPTRLPHGLVC